MITFKQLNKEAEQVFYQGQFDSEDAMMVAALLAGHDRGQFVRMAFIIIAAKNEDAAETEKDAIDIARDLMYPHHGTGNQSARIRITNLLAKYVPENDQRDLLNRLVRDTHSGVVAVYADEVTPTYSDLPTSSQDVYRRIMMYADNVKGMLDRSVLYGSTITKYLRQK